jgi:hypothetical protein
MKARSFWLLAVLLVACSASGACAQAVRWEVTVGFGSTYKEGAWTPVFVDLSNEGSSQIGELVVPVSYGRPVVRVVNHAISVDLPRNSRKRYTLYVTSEGLEQVYLNLAGARRQKRELPPTREAAGDDTLVVVVGGDTGLLNFLTGTQAAAGADWAKHVMPSFDPYGGFTSETPVEAEIQVGHAAWDGLPESWLGWDGADAVVLGDAGFAGASPAALDALLRWVELGGTLIVPGGALSPEMAASPIAGLLPIALTGTATLPDLAPLGQWADQPIDLRPVLVGRGALVPGAATLCGSPDQPLIAVRSVGSGKLVFTTFDFGAAPVRYWDGQTSMWPRLLAQAPSPPSLAAAAEYVQTQPYFSPEMDLRDAATYTPAAELPPIWLILGFLGAYIVVLVPVNYHLLKRFDRRELAWVTTPAIVVVFTLGAYALGYGIRGGEIVLNRLGVIEVAPDASLARGRGYVGLFSPGRTSYQLLLEESAAGARDLARGDERTRGTTTIYSGPTPSIDNVGMNMWTTRAFGVEFLADLQGGISGVVEYDAATGLRARVKNDTALPLKQCRIIRQYSQGGKKDILPGREVELAFTRGQPVDDGLYRRSRRGASADVRDGMTNIAIAALFGERQSHYGGGPAPAGAELRVQPHFVALCDDPLVPVTLVGKRAAVNDRNIIIVRLPVQLTPNQRTSVPSWLISSRLIACDGRLSPRDPWDPGFTLETGTAVFEFRIPLGERGGRAGALALLAPLEAHPAQPIPSAQAGAGRRGGMRGGGPGGRMRAARGAGSSAPQTAPGAPPPGTQSPGVEISAYNFVRETWQPLPTAMQPMAFPNPTQSMSPDGRVLVKITVPSGDVVVESLDLSADVRAF